MKRRVEQINMHNNMQANTGLLAVENFDFPNYILSNSKKESAGKTGE